MKPDLRSLASQARPAVEPLVGLAFFVFWMVMDRSELSLDLIGMRRFVACWIVVLGLIALAIAFSRHAPRFAIALSLAAVIAQFAWSMARFWDGAWPIYSGYLLLFLSIGISIPDAVRRRTPVFLGVTMVLVTALITIPALGGSGRAQLFGRSATMGAGTTLRNFFVVLAVALVLSAAAWLLGALIRYRVAVPGTTLVPEIDLLSVREREVFRLAANGLTNPEIASHLYVSEATVKSHMTSILAKLELSSRSRLIAFAHENALVH